MIPKLLFNSTRCLYYQLVHMDWSPFFLSSGFWTCWSNLKHTSSLPTTKAACAVYIQNETILIEGLIYKRALSFFGDDSRQDKKSTEQQLAARQLTAKSSNSSHQEIACQIQATRPYRIVEGSTIKVCMEAYSRQTGKRTWAANIKISI